MKAHVYSGPHYGKLHEVLDYNQYSQLVTVQYRGDTFAVPRVDVDLLPSLCPAPITKAATVSPVTWRDCKTDPPDADLTVLVFDPTNDGEIVWLGWKDAECWYWSEGHTIKNPTLWAELPYPEAARNCSKTPVANPPGESKAQLT
jgi:hypothetical protein